jgi:hypothetical protein
VYRRRIGGGLRFSDGIMKDGGSGREAEAVSSTGMESIGQGRGVPCCMYASERILSSPNWFRISWKVTIGV